VTNEILRRASSDLECVFDRIREEPLPTVFELLSGGLDLMRQVREVQVEDVLAATR